MGHHSRRFGYSYRQNEKKKINRRQSKKPPSLRLRGLINRRQNMTAHAYGCAVKKKNKPKAEQESAQPTAARFKKKKKTEGRARNRPAFKKKKNKPKAEQETAQPTAARFKNDNLPDTEDMKHQMSSLKLTPSQLKLDVCRSITACTNLQNSLFLR